MSTYGMALQRAQFSARKYGENYFVYHQPEACETRDTGWHMIDETEYITSPSSTRTPCAAQ